MKCRDRSHRPPAPAERKRRETQARAHLETLRGIPFTDEEWEEVRRTVRRFFALLREWDAS